LYNKPGKHAIDVYKGCKIDYSGNAVNPKNFMKVLTGQGSGKVLKSTSNDHVFINFVDHGGSGVICFPSDDLHVKDLQKTLSTMHSAGMYKKLAFYLETCESGSMFKGYNVPGVYAVSAASPTESSWAEYCGSDAVVNGKKMGTCLGDLFSVTWMEDSDSTDITKETLQEQFKLVKKKTASQQHGMQWSDTSFTNHKVSAYQGQTFQENTDKLTRANSESVNRSESPWSVRELELKQAQDNYLSASTPEELADADAELKEVMREQEAVRVAFEKFMDLMYPGNEGKKVAIRDAGSLPENRDCEMSAHQSFQANGAFDARSGFALQFQKYVVNVCADVLATDANVDVAEIARQACLGEIVV